MPDETRALTEARRMQAKDVPDLPVLRFLDSLQGAWANWFGNEYANSVTHAMPAETPEKVVRAKMASMIRRGIVDGCSCGCRGDYVLTIAGRRALARATGEKI